MLSCGLNLLPCQVPVAYSGGVDERPSKDMLPLFSPFFDTSDAPMPPILTSLATVDRLFAEDLAYFVPRLAKGDAKIQVDVYEHQFHVSYYGTGVREVVWEVTNDGSLRLPKKRSSNS